MSGGHQASTRVGLRYLSVCSGIEAATVAWAPLGLAAVGFSEIEAFPSAVLAHHYGSNMPGEPLSRNGVPNFGDFTLINLAALPAPVDVLVGGTPCQAFSIAGKRLSLADARGNLTLSYVVLAHGLADTHGLRNAVWENVPGCLSTDDNAFGCFLGALVGVGDALLPSPKPGGRKGNDLWTWSKEINGFRPKWPSFGLVAGPRGRAAWRVLGAEWFGLAQRRDRVFVVADFGGGADPATVLFERASVHGNSPPRREARQGAGERSAFGGGRTSGPIDKAATLTAQGGGRAMDFEVETFVAEVTKTLPAGGNATGGDRPPGMGQETADTFLVAHTAPTLPSRTSGGGGLGTDHDLDGGLIAHSLRGEGFDASEDGTGRGTPIVPVLAQTLTRGGESAGKGGYAGRRQEDDSNIVAYRTTGNDGCYETGDLVGALSTATDLNAHVLAYAIQERAVSENPNAGPQGAGFKPDQAYTLEARHHVQAVAFDLRGREGGAEFEGPHDTANMRAASGGSSRSYVAQEWAVRRLTPRECERLQGFPDGYTAIPWRGKAAENCPDGPRYKGLGNSMAVPVMEWIGKRLLAAMPERVA